MSCGVSEEDLLCPVCFDIFTEPVLLSCSHSVCRPCVQQFWSSRGFQECPVCRKRFPASHPDPTANLALRNVCQSVIESRSSASEELCGLHGEKLKLFCLDDQHLLCLVCRDSEKHLNHSFRPAEEAAPLLKEELKIQLKHLQGKRQTFQEIKQTFDDAAQHIKAQTQQSRRLLQEEFEQLHQFLREEETSRISALMLEENQKSHQITLQIEQIDKDIEALSNNISAVTNELAAASKPFLQNFMLSKERVQITPQDPQMRTGALINVAEHLGNLKFKVWEKMQEIVQITPVILDPNTAHPLLTVTNDLAIVKSSTEGQPYPENPERFDYFHCVLGSEGFNSGKHHWDVEVLNNTCWSVGVTTATNQRKGDFFHSGVWRVRYMSGQYTTQSALSQRTPLNVQQRLKVIRVKLDRDAGIISFSDPLSNTHLHTFNNTFTEAVFPFLYSSCIDFPLRILPVKFSVTMEEVK